MGRLLGDDLSPSRRSDCERLHPPKVVILAGGRGTRLRPYTSVLPKPLMPIGDRSILQIVVDQLARHHFRDVVISVGHLAHLIQAVFGNRSRHGVDITYVREDIPLGTAGPLRLVNGLDSTFLMMNGDLLTTLDYSDLLRHHRDNGNVVTIAAHRRRISIDYGVLSVGELERVVDYHEKPEVESLVSMGVYVIEPEALDYIPADQPFDFPDLVRALLDDGAHVGTFVHEGLWLDIGRHEDYEEAVASWNAGELDCLEGVGYERTGTD